MVRRKQVLNFGSSGCSFESPPQAWIEYRFKLEMSLNELQDQEHTTLTAALKSLIHPLAFSFKYPSGHRSPQDFGDDLYLCVFMNQELITITSCASQPAIHTSHSPLLQQWAMSSSSTRIGDGQVTLLMHLKHHSNSSKDQKQVHWVNTWCIIKFEHQCL